VQISDTHVGDLDGEARTAQVVAAINALPFPIACVVHTGDLAEDEASAAIAQAELAELAAPLHVVPGNHDIAGDADAQAFVARWGALSSSAEVDGVVLLFVYDQAAPSLGYEPLAWLEGALAAAGSRPVIVFHHEPPVDDFYNNVLHAGWPDDKRRRWTELLGAHGVVADVAGHFHRDEQHLLGAVPLYVAEPVSTRFGHQPAFRIYEYAGGRLSYRTVYLEGS
jgi:3',5'-cyclic-AMP phosphodiesterase